MTYLEFRVTLAIKLALQVHTEPSFVKWANGWLDGSDRTAATAYSASTTDYAAATAAADYAAVNYAAASFAAAASADSSIRNSMKLGAKLESVIKFL